MGTEDLKTYCVYLITNLVNGKQYAGQTKRGFLKRWRAHLKEAKKGSRRILCSAIRKYGEDAFITSVFREKLTKEQADAEEILLIKTLRLTERGFGYNQTAGGEGTKNLVVSEETKDKIRKYSENMTPSHRQNLSEARKGIKLSASTKAKLSTLRKGKPKSEEHKKKLRAVRLGKPLSSLTKNKMREAALNMSVDHKKKISEAGKRKDISEATVMLLVSQKRSLNSIARELGCSWKVIRRIVGEYENLSR